MSSASEKVVYVTKDHMNKVVRVWTNSGKKYEGLCIGVNSLGQQNTMRIQTTDQKTDQIKWVLVGGINRVDVLSSR